ncbi:MAG: hypothetical protein LC803_09320 [Acidobacteria bacterium]|nr:hypothetical protein [Acidobacteriota bacterium]
MARSLHQIMTEIDPAYAGSRNTIHTQLQGIPGETQAQLSGLEATAQQSHQGILDAARRRGLGFAGIPVGEQAKYDSTVFKPAVADLYSKQTQRKSSLDEALQSIFRNQMTQASGLHQSELDREEQQRQFNANLAWQREQLARQEASQREAGRIASRASSGGGGGGGGYFGGGGGGGAAAAAPPAPKSNQKGIADYSPSRGWQFADQNGRPVVAETFARLNGINFRDLLAKMSSTGDRSATALLNDWGSKPGYPKNPKYRNLISI